MNKATMVRSYDSYDFLICSDFVGDPTGNNATATVGVDHVAKRDSSQTGKLKGFVNFRTLNITFDS